MSGGHRRGRRDNGLHASAYAVAGDVDPRVGEHLLDVLGLAGIAAYLQPTADLHPVTRTTTLPSRPIDRLYVDRDHLTEARGFLDKLGPAAAPSHPTSPDPGSSADPSHAGGPARDEHHADPPPADPTAEPAGRPDATGGGADLDSAWAAIVADFDTPADSPVPPWPVEEDLPDNESAPSVETARPVGGDSADETRFDLPRWRGSGRPGDLLDAMDEAGTDDDVGYQPPPPPPIPRPSRYTALAIGAMVVGLALCVRPDVLDILGFGSAGGLVVGFCCLLAGVVIVVARLRPGDDEDSDGDDGAVV